MKVKLAGIEKNSVVDGPGLRSVVFAQGCPHHCPGCHNPQTLDPEGGTWYNLDELAAELCADNSVRGITFSGGEPFRQAGAFAALAAYLRERKLEILIYSGYTYEGLLAKATGDPDIEKLLAAGDILIDGPFIVEERDPSLAYRGSRNQRVIDLKQTSLKGEVVLSPLHYR
ncbi:MAG: radical SAM protein [Clostridiales bacterium]|jgi:anaerobic ribonucleoside-triphosphate reductase activating protein|nr:radical SAM protein [Clostridiales bacterium]